MIKKIIQLADLHIPNDTKSAHTEEKLKKLVKSIIEEVGKSKEETRVVIVGDIYQNKIKVSNEAKAMLSTELSEQDNNNICCCRKP